MCHSLITRSMAHAQYMRKMLRITSNKLSNDRHIIAFVYSPSLRLPSNKQPDKSHIIAHIS